MKKLLLIFLIIYSSQSFAEWTRIGKVENLYVMYIDIDNFRLNDEYLLYWDLVDFQQTQESSFGKFKSTSSYHQLDCKLFRQKLLAMVLYKDNMGKEILNQHNFKDQDWVYPSPNSMPYIKTKQVCSIIQ